MSVYFTEFKNQKIIRIRILCFSFYSQTKIRKINLNFYEREMNAKKETRHSKREKKTKQKKEATRRGEKKTKSEIRISMKRVQNHLPNNAHFCCRLPTT